jgi:hypothetical protein
MSRTKAMPGAENGGQMSIDEWQEAGMTIISSISNIITMPVESLLRPRYGTRYFAAPTFFLSLIMLLVAAALKDIATGISQLLPMGRPAAPVGAFGIGSFAALFFLTSMIQGFRIWRLMIHPELEQISVFEGPAWPIFDLLPMGGSFWFVRCVWEPLFVFFMAIVLSNFLIVQNSLKIYLQVAAVCLAMKCYITWYRSWAYIRGLMDMANIGPIIASIVNSSATEDELARVHLAGLPRNMPDHLRRATADHLARDFNAEVREEKPQSNPEAGSATPKFILQAMIVAALICYGMVWFTSYRQHIHLSEMASGRSPFGLKGASREVPGVISPGATQSHAATPVSAPPPPGLTRLTGYWEGRGYLGTRVCILKVEIRRAPQDGFSAYTGLTCFPLGMRPSIYGNVRLNPPTPVSTIFSGAVADGALQFHADKTIAGGRCPVTALTVTPFGAKQVAADWKDGCRGGQMVLQRVNQ